MLGVLVSWPSRGLFSRLRDKKAVKRLVGISFVISLALALWTVSRIVSFMAMTGRAGNLAGLCWLDLGINNLFYRMDVPLSRNQGLSTMAFKA